MMKILQAVSLVLGIIVSALTIVDKTGISLPPILSFVNEQSNWLLPVLCILFGFAAGWNARKLKEARARPVFMDPVVLDEKERKAARDVVSDMDVEFKALLRAAVDKGTVYADADEWRMFSGRGEDYYRQFLTWSYADGNKAVLKPTERMVKLRSDCSDLFDQASSTMNQHGIERGRNVRFSSSGMYGMPSWWWYK